MSKIVIRENNILAIETRSGLFVIAQALKHKTLIFFNLFTTTPMSFNVDLSKAKILCCITPVKNFYNQAEIIKLKTLANAHIKDYDKRNHLSLNYFTSSGLDTGLQKDVRIYAGTEDEIVIPFLRTGDLRLVDWQLNTIQYLSKEYDGDIINQHQLETMGDYAELCERLYLSYRYGKYIEPIKDYIMGNTPIEYKTFFQMIAGQISKEQWLKLPIENVLY
ncbi:MAG: hypothetical protein FWE32_07000 [Oscillospiraceae bacterium]|nr:hypothetical protein [Oscillospiraceae bacterium]